MLHDQTTGLVFPQTGILQNPNAVNPPTIRFHQAGAIPPLQRSEQQPSTYSKFNSLPKIGQLFRNMFTTGG